MHLMTAGICLPHHSLLSPGAAHEIAIGLRIGITKAVHHPWRFGAKEMAFLSKKF